MRLWDPATGQQIGKPLTGHTSSVRAVCPVPQPDGRTLLATGSYDRKVLVWKLDAHLTTDAISPRD